LRRMVQNHSEITKQATKGEGGGAV
jgi:hypothetical protein